MAVPIIGAQHVNVPVQVGVDLTPDGTIMLRITEGIHTTHPSLPLIVAKQVRDLLTQKIEIIEGLSGAATHALRGEVA